MLNAKENRNWFYYFNTFVIEMKSKIFIYYTSFFSFCMLVSLSAGVYQNINNPVLKTNFKISKHFSLSGNEQNVAYSNILFEENKSETFKDFKTWANLIPDLISNSRFEKNRSTEYTSHFLVEKQTNPIYISVCNFRI